MDREEFLELIDKYLKGYATPLEKQQLREYFNSFQEEDGVEAHLESNPGLEEKMLSGIRESIGGAGSGKTLIRRIPWMQAAAALIIFCLVSASVYYYTRPTSLKQEFAQQQVREDSTDVNPAGYQATLILADNSRILLDQASEGLITENGGIRVTKKSNGELVYESYDTGGDNSHGVMNYHTITTPKGGKYKVILPDGSTVWLNAASSLKYPVRFSDSARRVEFSGEAYFDIAKKVGKDKQRVPFFVNSRNQVIEVLGTHFNINAYGDQGYVKTTLIEGSVKVINPQSSKEPKLLKPGQQALTRDGDAQTKVVEADPRQTIAWKEGYFMFRKTGIYEIGKELERWYDVEIEYEGQMPPDSFTGYISRDVKISGVLKMLEESGVLKFEIRGRKIVLSAPF